MAKIKWNLFILSLGFLVGGVVTLIRSQFSFTVGFLVILGLAGVIITGQPLWIELVSRLKKFLASRLRRGV